MVRRAVLAAVLLFGLLAASCGGGPSGTVTLATHAAERSPARSSVPSSQPAVPVTPTAQNWYTSAAANARYYYCEADGVEIAAKNRRDYPTEQALLAEWGGRRSKWPQSKCN